MNRQSDKQVSEAVIDANGEMHVYVPNRWRLCWFRFQLAAFSTDGSVAAIAPHLSLRRSNADL